MKILEIKIVKAQSEKVRARADIHFEGFWLNGFKVLQDIENKKEFVTPPSYKAGPIWRTLFKTDSVEDWQDIQTKVLKKFREDQMKAIADETKESLI